MEQSKIDEIVEAYATDYDNWPQNRQVKQEQYERGQKYARECVYIAISVSGCWSARRKDGASVQSYEVIGRHAHTNQLVKAWLESGIPVRDHRYRLGYYSCPCGNSAPVDRLEDGRCPICRSKPFPTIETELEMVL